MYLRPRCRRVICGASEIKVLRVVLDDRPYAQNKSIEVLVYFPLTDADNIVLPNVRVKNWRKHGDQRFVPWVVCRQLDADSVIATVDRIIRI